jgi:hypothetical protein
MSDYDSPLTEEILTDVAQTFFGKRKKLDDMIDIFERFVDALKQKADRVEQEAGLLHYLLVEDDLAKRFYPAIGVGDPGDLAQCRPPKPLPGRSVPFALTGRGRFVRLVYDQYRRLEKTCREYRCSSANPLAEAENPVDACVDARLVEAVRELVNEKIREVNAHSSPSAVLQYAKGFDTGKAKKSKVAGATGGEYEGLDRKYVYRPISEAQMGLKRFPDLPGPEHCRARLERFCKKIHSRIGPEVKKRMSRLNEAGGQR